MKISVIMAACNQGDFLRETVESAVQGLEGCPDWEIIVIDDHSTDGCCDEVEQTDRIKVHRPEKKLGVSHARHLAGTMATGDVIITTDTHYKYPPRSLWRLGSCWAMKNRAIVIPAIDMENDSGGSQIEFGRMVISQRGLRIDRPHKRPETACMFGGLYIMRRDVWSWLGGWIQLPGYWAGEEQMMTLLAYRFGIPILIVDKHVCKHRRYRRHNQYPYELPKEHPAEIAHYIHATCFPDTYVEYWQPLLESYYGHVMTSDPKPLAEWIRRRSIRSESWVIKNVLGVGDLDQHPVFQKTEQMVV